MSFVKKLFSNPTFERELSNAISHEVRAMDSLSQMAPKIYSYHASAANVASSSGAFGGSKVVMRQCRVDKPVETVGLFGK
eukprot:CAMPEP_0116025040 /NCGR_PEP_ID=MMETSP0321-20121206/12751_1 /TAXON_ID=163516 /ORGANISM="Leptocylindrus danicus var. danicus, Strain B650" /LENGTH=79 /DNA_ID=CAMNT_0003497037 /DNA_START=106 /DNA_END=345 /DNA_ORIENTATION=+